MMMVVVVVLHGMIANLSATYSPTSTAPVSGGGKRWGRDGLILSAGR